MTLTVPSVTRNSMMPPATPGRARTPSLTSGSVSRSSVTAHAVSSTTAAASSPVTRGEVHPQAAPSVIGSSAATSPPASSRAPGTSARRTSPALPWTVPGGTTAALSAPVTAQMPAIARNTARQSPPAACSTAPPSANPTPAAAPSKAVIPLMALGRSSRDRCSRTIAMLSAVAANPGAAMIRPASRVAAFGAAALTTDPRARQAIAAVISRRWPMTAPSAGNSAAHTVPVMIVATTIQPIIVPLACSEAPIWSSIVNTIR
jgi:hypothetical protein